MQTILLDTNNNNHDTFVPAPKVLSNKHALFAVWKVVSFNTFCFTWESLSYMGWAPAVYGLVIISLFHLSIFYQKEWFVEMTNM